MRIGYHAPEVGDRIKLVYTTDPYTNLKKGDEGTITMLDSVGTVHVRWDTGSTLGMVPDEDRFEVIT